MLPADIEVWVLQMPGRENRFRETPPASIESAAAEVAKALAVAMAGPFALFGHSMGAILAFETSRRLRYTADLSHLFVSASPPPHRFHGRNTSRLTDAELLEHLRRFDGTPQAVLDDPELLGLVLPRIRSDFKLIDRYCHCAEPPLDIPVTALFGQDDPGLTTGQVAEWAMHTTARFSSYSLPGGHFFVDSSLPSVIDRITTALDETD